MPVYKKGGPFRIILGHLGFVFSNCSFPQNVFPPKKKGGGGKPCLGGKIG